MEENINKAAILKDKPKGTKLYTILSDGECFLNEASEDSIYIDIDNREHFWCFSAYGSTHSFPNGCVLLFPSKEMRDWSKFAWKKGDVLVGKYNVYIIFEGFTEDTYIRFKGRHYLCKECGEEDYSKKEVQMLTSFFRKANDDEAQNYINTIEERFGGKLNLETLEIEKAQPEFKDGDIVVYKCEIDDVPSNIFIFRGISQRTPYYSYYASLDSDGFLSYKLGGFGIYKRKLRLATDSEKQKLFDALAKENKAWDAEKKQIVDLKPKWTPKPFDRVITRGDDDSIWTANIFSHIDRYGQYVTIGCIGGYPYCIPYNEETAKLIGTTNNWEG